MRASLLMCTPLHMHLMQRVYLSAAMPGVKNHAHMPACTSEESSIDDTATWISSLDDLRHLVEYLPGRHIHMRAHISACLCTCIRTPIYTQVWGRPTEDGLGCSLDWSWCRVSSGEGALHAANPPYPSPCTRCACLRLEVYLCFAHA